jgi:hypothetical protein
LIVLNLTPDVPLVSEFKRISIDARIQDSGMHVAAVGSLWGRAVSVN